MLTAQGRRPRREWGGVACLLGAGCSFSAGIPLAETLARKLVLQLAHDYSFRKITFDDADVALDWLKKHERLPGDIKWPLVYGELFRTHYPDPTRQRRIIADALDAAAGINWAHACLGELVRGRFVHSVLTTNFDNLALEGMIRCDVLPAIADGVDSLHAVEGQPEHPQLIHIHGTRSSYHLRNSPSDTREYAGDPGVVRMAVEILRSTPALIVVGYAGGEDGVMTALTEAARSLRVLPPIFWVAYDRDPDAVSPLARTLLSFSREGGVVTGMDADDFFAQVMRGVGLDGPSWLIRPIAQLKERGRRVAKPKQGAIAAVVDTYLMQIEALAEASSERLGDVAYLSGSARAASDHLRFAVDAYRRALDETDADDDRARLLHKLGVALQQYGKRQSDPAFVEEAIRSYREAIRLSHGELGSQPRADSQLALAAALRLLNDLRSDPTLLVEALQQYDAVLKVYSRKTDPVRWAKAKSNLSATLFTLAEIELSVDRLDRAADACVEALEILNEAAAPRDGLKAMINCANARLRRADFELDLDAVNDAERRYRAARALLSSGHDDQLLAANVHNGLAATMLLRGERTGNSRDVAAAIDAFTEARTLRAKSEVPRLWASVQLNLAEARLIYARSQESPEWLRAADDHCGEALAILETGEGDGERARGEVVRGTIQTQLGVRASGEATLEVALGYFDRAIGFYAHRGLPASRASAWHGRAVALTEIAFRTRRRSAAVDAIDTIGRALSIRKQATVPLDWAVSAHVDCRARWALATIDGAENQIAREITRNAAAAAMQLGPRRQPATWAECLLFLIEVATVTARLPIEPVVQDAVDSYFRHLAQLQLADLAPLLWAHSRRAQGRWSAIVPSKETDPIAHRARCYEGALATYRRCEAWHDVNITEALLSGLS